MEPADLTKRFLEQRDSLYAYVLALTGEHAVAEEVFQEVGVAVLSEAAKGTVPDDTAAWLRGLARHRIADHYRLVARRRGMERGFDRLEEVVELAFSEETPDPAADQADLVHLRACLENLAPRARAIVDARYQRNQSLAEIAGSVDWTEAAVKSALAKARKALAQCITRQRARGVA